MQRVSGLLLITAGVAIGAHQLSSSPDRGAEELAEIVRISAAPDREPDSAPIAKAEGPRTFSAAAPLIAPMPSAKSPVTTKEQPGTPWSTVVTSDKSAALKSSKPGDAATRWELARDLQRELTRVGCYGGEINGAWTASTRRAMAAFMERVNAALPFDEPDYILLTLVQGEKSAVCTAECPANQTMAANGQCTPTAVIAQQDRKAKRDEQRRLAAEARRLERERRAIAKAQVADAKLNANAAPSAPARIAKADLAATARIAADLPWLAEDRLLGAQLAARREPLPGRMSVGAAAVAPAPAVSPAPSTSPETAQRARDALAAVEPIDDGSEDAVNARGEAYVQPVERNENLRGAHAVKRPAPVASARPKKKRYYADAGYYPKRKNRRGLPRPGSLPYLQQQSLGGFF